MMPDDVRHVLDRLRKKLSPEISAAKRIDAWREAHPAEVAKAQHKHPKAARGRTPIPEVARAVAKLRRMGYPEWAARLHAHRESLTRAVAWVDANLGEATPTPKNSMRGRSKADYATVQREAEIAAEWARARETGVYLANWAHEQGMTPADLRDLLARVRMRDYRANK